MCDIADLTNCQPTIGKNVPGKTGHQDTVLKWDGWHLVTIYILSSNQALGHKLTTEVCFYVVQL